MTTSVTTNRTWNIIENIIIKKTLSKNVPILFFIFLFDWFLYKTR